MQCPKCGYMLRYLFILLTVLVLNGCGGMSVEEFNRQAKTELNRNLAGTGLSLTCDDTMLYVDCDSTVASTEWESIARGWAYRFMRYRKEKLGVAHVTACVRVSGKIICYANASDGRVQSFAWGAP